MTHPKSILVVSSTFPRWANDTEPPFVMELSKRLLKENINIDVLAPHAPGAKRIEMLHGLTVYRYRYFFNQWQLLAYQGGILSNLKNNKLLYLLLPLFLLSQIIAILRLIKKNHYDLIHAHWLIPQGLLAIVATKCLAKNRPKILCTSHGGDLFALRSTFFKQIKKWVLHRCDGITVVSQYMREVCLQITDIAEKIHVCSMGADLNHTFRPLAHIAKDNNAILFVGRLAEKKGVAVLLDAMRLLKKRFPKLTLLIVGKGPEQDRLQVQCRRLAIADRVCFLGALPQEQLPEIYASASITVMPSIIDSNNDQEGLPVVVIEAMGCGCAVIASSLPAIKGVIEHGVNGILTKPGEATELANAIEALLIDEKTRQTIASAARKSVVEKFDWQTITQHYLKIIKSTWAT